MTKKLLSDAQLAYLKEIAPGRPNSEVVDLMNVKFGTTLNLEQIRSAKSRERISSGLSRAEVAAYTKRNKLLTDEQQAFLAENVLGRPCSELTRLINETFNLNLTEKQVHAAKQRSGLRSELDTKFEKGSIPPNKGRKGYCAPGSEKGWFARGSRPKNQVPIGTEIITRDGYPVVKVADPNKWKMVHVKNWEEVNGPVPEGFILLHADGDQANADLSNLILASKAELLTMNRHGLIKGDKDLTITGHNIAKLYRKIAEVKNGN